MNDQDMTKLTQDPDAEATRIRLKDIVSTGQGTRIPGLPVAGYAKTQSPEAVALVNGFKATEERILRELDALAQVGHASLREEIRASLAGETPNSGPTVDLRWLAIGRTQIEQAFMAINRAVFKPGRVSLPEDGTADGRFHHYEDMNASNVAAEAKE